MKEEVVIDSPEKFKEESMRFLKPSCSSTVVDRLRGLKDLYHRFLSDTSISTEIIDKADHIWDAIIASIKYHQIGLFTKALDTLYNDVFINQEATCLGVVEKGTPSYRMRYSEISDVFSDREMFHVPISKRHILHNERFSVSGMPVLYLAGCIYTCWEELGRKNFDNCNVSAFYPVKDITCVRFEPIWISYYEEDILIYPLSIACFLDVNHPDGEYKEEYVIPQLVMQCVLRYNIEHEDKIDGVLYFSSKVLRDNGIFDMSDIADAMYNLALPAMPEYDDMGYSIALKDMFQLTSPETYGRLRLFNPHGQYSRSNNTYDKSAFGIMESYCNNILDPKSLK